MKPPRANQWYDSSWKAPQPDKGVTNVGRLCPIPRTPEAVPPRDAFHRTHIKEDGRMPWKCRPRPGTIQQAVPCELNAEMTPADIAFELKQLQFEHSEFRRIKID